MGLYKADKGVLCLMHFTDFLFMESLESSDCLKFTSFMSSGKWKPDCLLLEIYVSQQFHCSWGLKANRSSLLVYEGSPV